MAPTVETPTPPGSQSNAQFGDQHKECTNGDATATLERIKGEHGFPSTTDVLVRTGHAAQTILDVAEEVNSDAVVLAAHAPGLADYFLGSVASRVVRHAHYSVHIVRSVKR